MQRFPSRRDSDISPDSPAQVSPISFRARSRNISPHTGDSSCRIPVLTNRNIFPVYNKSVFGEGNKTYGLVCKTPTVHVRNIHNPVSSKDMPIRLVWTNSIPLKEGKLSNTTSTDRRSRIPVLRRPFSLSKMIRHTPPSAGRKSRIPVRSNSSALLTSGSSAATRTACPSTGRKSRIPVFAGRSAASDCLQSVTRRPNFSCSFSGTESKHTSSLRISCSDTHKPQKKVDDKTTKRIVSELLFASTDEIQDKLQEAIGQVAGNTDVKEKGESALRKTVIEESCTNLTEVTTRENVIKAGMGKMKDSAGRKSRVHNVKSKTGGKQKTTMFSKRRTNNKGALSQLNKLKDGSVKSRKQNATTAHNETVPLPPLKKSSKPLNDVEQTIQNCSTQSTRLPPIDAKQSDLMRP